MKIDLNVIPTTFDAIHAGLAATVAGLFFLQVLFLLLVMFSLRRRVPPEARRAQPEPTAARVEPAVPAVKTETVVVKEAVPDAALQLLGLLQKEARFIDFIKENVAGYSDADIGGVARVVHKGCLKVMQQYFDLEPVRQETEGQRITLAKGFDPAAVRLTGNIVGEAPFTGTLVHRGWRVTGVKLPKINPGHESAIVAAAEVEL
jgi:hypothetical protein